MNRSGVALLVATTILATADRAIGGECGRHYKRAHFDEQVARSRADSTFVPRYAARYDPPRRKHSPRRLTGDVFVQVGSSGHFAT
jgi:hypothetical protein